VTTRRLVQSWPRGENTAADLIAFRITGYEANQPTGMQNTAPVHDALCIAALVDPSLIATKFVNVVIETQSKLAANVRSAVLSSITRSGRSARPIATSRSPPSAMSFSLS
jgi:inosine-uridine nucleoside N-ribohydrolase